MTPELLGSVLLATTGLAALIGLIAVLARGSAAALRHTLWRLALVGFWLIPVILIAAQALNLRAYAVRVPVPAVVQFSLPSAPAPPAPASPALSTATLGDIQPDRRLTLPPVNSTTGLLLLWLVGAVAGGVCLGRKMRRVGGLLGGTTMVEDPVLLERARHWAAEMGLARTPALARSEAVSVPMVAGWRMPVVLLPSEFAPEDEGSEAVLVHELAHLRRGDVATVWLARLTQALWWWHPLVWLVVRELQSTAEEACDDWAIVLTGRPKAYASVLVHWAEAGASASNIACAYQGRALVRRVKRILAERSIPMLQLSTRVKAVLVVGVLCAIVAVGALRLEPTPALGATGGGPTEQPGTITIQGRVLGPDGATVSGAQIRAYYRTSSDKTAFAHTISAADGSFSFTVEVGNVTHNVRVAALKEGLALGLASAKPGEECVLKLGSDPVTCAGVVVSPEGAPIAGAQVWVRILSRTAVIEIDTTGRQKEPQALITPDFDNGFLGQLTDAQGRFAFRGLPSGTYVQLSADAASRASYRSFDAVPASQGNVTIVLQPEAVISGRVTHQGQPVPGVRVLCQSQDNAPRGWGDVTTGADGAFRLGGLPASTYNVMLDPPEGLCAKAIEGVTVRPGEQFTGAEFQLIPGGLVRGIVTDSVTGQPLAHMTVSACGPARPLSGAAVQPTHTDEAGRYSLRLPEGRNKVYTYGPQGQGYVERWVDVVEGQTLTGINFTLKPFPAGSVSLRGRIIGDGKVLSGVSVAAIGFSQAETFEDNFTAKSDAEGNFELAAPKEPRPNGSGGWCVLAYDPARGLAGATFMETKADPNVFVHVRVSQGGYLAAQVVDTEGHPVPDVPLGITLTPPLPPPTPARFAPQRSWVMFRGHQTDKRGIIRLGPLPAGLNVAVTPSGKFQLSMVKFNGEHGVIPAGGTLRLPPLVLNPQGRTLTGRVTDAAGNPVKQAYLFVSWTEERFRSDAVGNYRLTGLPALGKLWVVAMHPTKQLIAAASIDPDTGAHPTMVLRPPVSAGGRIVNAQGKPMKGLRLRGYAVFPITGTGSRDAVGYFEMFTCKDWEQDLQKRLGQRGDYLGPVTDARGKWRIDGLIPGAHYYFDIELPGSTHGLQRYDFITQPSGVTDAGTLVLKN